MLCPGTATRLLLAMLTLLVLTTTTTATAVGLQHNNESYSVMQFGPGLTDKQMLDRLLHKHRYDNRVKPKINPLQV